MKKGFISMTIVYSFLLVFIFTLLAFLLLYTQKSRLVDSIVNEAKEQLYTNSPDISGGEISDPLPDPPTIVDGVDKWLNNNIRYVKSCSEGSSVDTINHWTEIEVMSGGVNVALGKTVTNDQYSSHTLYNPQYITDGRIDNVTPTSGYGYIESTDGGDYRSMECIYLDLGQEYKVDKITVWRYYLDNRTYYADMTFVAGNDGIYYEAIYLLSPETESGKKVEAGIPYFDGYYAYEGKNIWFDGIINTGTSSRSTSTTSWKNLSYFNPASGTIVNGTWGDNYLQLNGTNSWVNTGFYDDATAKYSLNMSVVFSVSDLPSTEQTILGNYQNGGYGIALQSDGKLVASYYSSSLNQYRKIYSDNAIVPGKKYTVVFVYGCLPIRNTNASGSTCSKYEFNMYVNGVLQSDKIVFSDFSATELKRTENNTVLAIGCDPNGASCSGGYFAGKIYSVRYSQSRGLLPEAVYYDYVYDRNRFGL